MKELLARGYARMFARPGRAQKVNHTLYHLALRGMGYNNGWQLDRSGEEWFVKHVLAAAAPRTCLDIGANSGEYSAALLKFTDARVIAFEPLASMEPHLSRLERQYPARFTWFGDAIGANDGTLMLHYSLDPARSEHASLSTSVAAIPYVGESNTAATPVDVVSLDSHLSAFPVGASNIDFIKIDVEGWEQEVLIGAARTIQAHRPQFIQIEMNLHQLFRGQTLRSLHALLPPGYAVYQLLPRGWRRVDVDRPESNTFCFGNFVFADQGAVYAP